PRAPLVLDVRRDAPYSEDPHLIAGALRPEGELTAFAARHAGGRPVVAYCAQGAEAGIDAATLLACAGLKASFLAGGIAGWGESGFSTIRRKPEWRVPGGSRWITRARPKIDRIACPWLIRRFIDPLATFDYVPTGQVFAQASARAAVPYDTAGAEVTHR